MLEVFLWTFGVTVSLYVVVGFIWDVVSPGFKTRV